MSTHSDRILYDVRAEAGALRYEAHGTTDLVAWVEPEALPELPLMPFTAELLGQPVVPLPPPPPDPAASGVGERPARGRRFAAYGLVTDPTGQVLLTLIAPGFPGAGHWHLPGGGTDHGEQPVVGLLRELAEEGGQIGRVTDLLEVSDRRNPTAQGPEGYPIDWHAVWAVYRVVVDEPTEARVTEAAGGSTIDARWFALDEAAGLPLSRAAAPWIARLTGEDPHK